jgi:hypothetical protein
MDHFVLPAVHCTPAWTINAVSASVKSTAADPVNMIVPLSCKTQDAVVNFFGKYITFHLEPQERPISARSTTDANL